MKSVDQPIVYQEPIIYQNQALCLKVWRFIQEKSFQHHQMSWHFHPEIELILIEEGEQIAMTPDATYILKPQDIVLFGSSELHRTNMQGNTPLKYIVLHLDLKPYFNPATMMYYGHFSELSEPLSRMNRILARREARLEVGTLITKIHEEVMMQQRGYELAVSAWVQQLLLTLYRHDHEMEAALPKLDTKLMEPVLAYIDAHLSETLDMRHVASVAGMSYSYFSKVFKKNLGTTFIDYVNRKRIAMAERLLVTKESTIEEIASDVGISNMAHFYELFKRFNGCTPKQYAVKMLHLDNKRDRAALSKDTASTIPL